MGIILMEFGREISERTGREKKKPRGRPFQPKSDPRRLQEQKAQEPIRRIEMDDKTPSPGNEKAVSAEGGYIEGTSCPKCAGRLDLKPGILQLRTNSKTGHRFLGCSNFPVCRFTRSVDETPDLSQGERLGRLPEVVEVPAGLEAEAHTAVEAARQKAQEGGQEPTQGEGEGREGQEEGEGQGGAGGQQGPPTIEGLIRQAAQEEAGRVLVEAAPALLETFLEEAGKRGLGSGTAEERQQIQYKIVEVKLAEIEKAETPGQHPAFKRVLEKAALGFNILMIGPAGCGKTHLAHEVAKALGKKFGTLSVTAGLPEWHLVGRSFPNLQTGESHYERSALVELFEEGGAFLADELDGGDPNTLMVINQALANGRLPIPSRVENPIAVRHPGHVFMAAANTIGKGADRIYVGRNQLDEAFLSRFEGGVVMLDYDRTLEATLAPNEKLLAKWWAIRDKAEALKLRRTVSTRGLLAAYRYVAVAKRSVDYAIFETLAGWTAEERSKVGVVAV